MTDTREKLRAARDGFEPLHDVLEALHRRRERRDRVRRRTAVALSLTLFLGLVVGLAISVRTAGGPASEPTETPAPPPRGIFSSVGGWIAFVDQGATWAVAPDGSEQTVLLDGRKDLWAQDWSPDGSRLLVALDDPGGSPWDLAVIEPDGSETTLVETSRFDGASFSPDGATVVYARWATASRRGQLLTVASDGSGKPRLLLESKDLLYEPTYSPDGTQIAYVDGGGDHSHTIRVVNADGTDVRVLIDATGPFDCRAHQGPRLVTRRERHRGRPGGPRHLHHPSPTARYLRLLIPGGGNPAWSPDGTQLAYSPSSVGTPSGVWVANADGSDPRPLPARGDAGPWNPGGLADRA